MTFSMEVEGWMNAPLIRAFPSRSLQKAGPQGLLVSTSQGAPGHSSCPQGLSVAPGIWLGVQ